MELNKAIKVLKTCIRSRLPVLLVGAPGVGKSDIVAQAAAAEGFDVILSHPVVADPTDAKGLPFPDKSGEFARFLPYGDLAKALSATRPTVWFLDDLGQAAPAVQASYMQLLLARQIGEHKLPDCITFVAATNRKSDRAGVSGILEPVKSRFATILDVEPSLDSWVDWALENGMPGELIAFLRFRPELLMTHKPTMEIVNSCSPRTWANLGRLQLAFAGESLDADLELKVATGAVGQTGAGEFVEFLRVWRDLPSPDSVLLDPDTARIPDGTSTLYALTTALAFFANPENFGRIVRYAERLHAAGHGEFASCLVRDCSRRCPEVRNTVAFVTAACGALGELFQ